LSNRPRIERKGVRCCLAFSTRGCYNRIYNAIEKGDLVPKQLLDKISIYVPKSKIDQQPVERLLKLADAKDRSVNYLVVEAILEFLKREEKRG
jgi:hypothetical protein